MNLAELFTRMVLWISAALIILPPLPSPVLFLLDTPSNFIPSSLTDQMCFLLPLGFHSALQHIRWQWICLQFWSDLTRWKMMSNSARSIISSHLSLPSRHCFLRLLAGPQVLQCKQNRSSCQLFHPTNIISEVQYGGKHYACSARFPAKKCAAARGGRYCRKNYRQPINQHFYNLSANYRYRKK